RRLAEPVRSAEESMCSNVAIARYVSGQSDEPDSGSLGPVRRLESWRVVFPVPWFGPVLEEAELRAVEVDPLVDRRGQHVDELVHSRARFAEVGSRARPDPQ